MNPIRFFINSIYESDRDFNERIFLLFSTLAEIGLFILFVADIAIHENMSEIIVLGISLVWNPLLVFLSLRKHKVTLGSNILSFALILVIMPSVFFFGGGLDGGAIIWFAFCFSYAGLLLKGRVRTIMVTLLTITILINYAIAYYFPQFVYQHSRKTYYIDSLVSVLVAGITIFAMVHFQNRVYISENKKAKEWAKKVEELSYSRDSFFLNMSHEIRTPINTILGLNEMILREDISDEVAEDAENIQAAGKLLLHLINDVLDMSKLESGQMTLTPVVYDPEEMLSDIVGILWLRAKDKDLDFKVDISPEIPAKLTGDEVRIKQILINVVNNAIKYTKKGSVTLSIARGETDGSRVNIIYSVTDTGIGIKKENIPHLFTAFKRVDEERNRYIEGTGLGLSIVKQLVDLMGGKVTVNSVYTRGSNFNIEIPQVISDARQIGEVDVAKRSARERREVYQKKFEAPDAHVLVVDDNVTNIMVAEKLLRDTKVHIDTALSGQEALVKTLGQEYNVILMDHLMPEMDGITCAHKIRNQTGGLSKTAKIVALTANAGSENQRLYEREGFDGYLTKPVAGNELESELLRLLPKNLITVVKEDSDILEDAVQWMRSNKRKKTVSVTTESVADIPEKIIEKYDISVIRHRVMVVSGEFRDGSEVDTRGILNYMEQVNDDSRIFVNTRSPEVAEYEEFFGRELANANNIVHIGISEKVKNSGCREAKEAAASFDNVTVIDSGFLSGGLGIMVLEACRMAERGYSAEEIKTGIEKMKEKMHTSFITENLDHLARAGQVSSTLARLVRSLMVRPVLCMRNGKITLNAIYFGPKENAWEKYIDFEIRRMGTDVPNEIFVNYAGLSKRELDYIRAAIKRRRNIEHIYFQEVSPATAANSGGGTFGVMYGISTGDT